MGPAVDRAVDALVEIDQRLVVAPPCSSRARSEASPSASRSSWVARSAARRAASGSSTGPHLAEAREISHVDGRDEHAAAGIDLDELLLRQPAQGLAHGRATDPEALDQLRARSRSRARRKLQRDDQLADREVRLVGERRPSPAGGIRGRAMPALATEIYYSYPRVDREARPKGRNGNDDALVAPRSRRRRRSGRSPRSPRPPVSSPTKSSRTAATRRRSISPCSTASRRRPTAS